MESSKTSLRWISTAWFPLVVCGIFLGILYGAYFSFLPAGVTFESIKLTDAVNKYALFIPVVIGVLTLIKVYILGLLKWIVRWKHWSGWLFVLILAFGSNAGIGGWLYYFEPKNTEIARFIIDWYSVPLMMASIGALLTIIAGIFLKKKA